MRLYLSFVLFLCLGSTLVNAQNQPTDLKFDRRPASCEKKWVAFPPNRGESKYGYGYIYMDEMAGFTFDFTGYFTVDNSGKYLVDTPKIKTATWKYRLQNNMPNVAIIPAGRFAEMGLPVEPSWVKIYYRDYTDTLKHNFRVGYNYNAAGECEAALPYLLAIYKKQPEYPGLIFELAYAYNNLKRTDDALKLLKSAIAKDDKNARLYRELGYAYMLKKDAAPAIKAFTTGMELARSNEDKSEMAYNLATVYKDSKNEVEYKNWMLKAKSLTAPNSRLYNAIVSQGF